MNFFERKTAVAKVTDAIRELLPWLPDHEAARYAVAFVNEEIWMEGDPVD